MCLYSWSWLYNIHTFPKVNVIAPESVLEKETYEILKDLGVQAVQLVQVRITDLVLREKKWREVNMSSWKSQQLNAKETKQFCSKIWKRNKHKRNSERKNSMKNELQEFGDGPESKIRL